MTNITVLFFAHLKEITGKPRITMTLPDDGTISSLKEDLVKTYPDLRIAMRTALLAVNQQFGFDDDPIPDGAEVAVFPPVSGGTELPTVYQITREEIDLDFLLEKITLSSTGAAAIFTGMVRGVTSRGEAHETVAL